MDKHFDIVAISQQITQTVGMIQTLLAIVALSALFILVFFFRYFLAGTGGLIAWANHMGIRGWALFIAAWLFLSPIMVILSVAYGYSLLREP